MSIYLGFGPRFNALFVCIIYHSILTLYDFRHRPDSQLRRHDMFFGIVFWLTTVITVYHEFGRVRHWTRHSYFTFKLFIALMIIAFVLLYYSQNIVCNSVLERVQIVSTVNKTIIGTGNCSDSRVRVQKEKPDTVFGGFSSYRRLGRTSRGQKNEVTYNEIKITKTVCHQGPPATLTDRQRPPWFVLGEQICPYIIGTYHKYAIMQNFSWTFQYTASEGILKTLRLVRYDTLFSRHYRRLDDIKSTFLFCRISVIGIERHNRFKQLLYELWNVII